MKKEFTLDIVSDNNFSVINRIVNVINRRRVRIKNLIAHEHDEDFHKGSAILLLYTTPNLMERVKHQIEKMIEVEYAKYYEGCELFYELAGKAYGRSPISVS